MAGQVQLAGQYYPDGARHGVPAMIAKAPGYMRELAQASSPSR